ncbi:MAG: peptide/nickel transport system ATP-binding protein [bacterium]|nr:MAG: Oligopeptide/dipeptide ABC transporter, ATPase subunit [bacterium 42_11]MDK2871835.1 peptide/nickel transport system ATP-binding protein [bacterium]
MEALLEVRRLKVGYNVEGGTLWAVDDVSFSVDKGEIVGIVGESGCGKTTLGLSFLRLLPPGSKLEGELLFDGRDIVKLSEEEIRALRGKEIAMVFQDPMTSLNPVLKIKEHFLETIRTHLALSEEEALKMASEVLGSVGIPPQKLEAYPFELSGGQRQRVMIALALVLKPKLIVADEPTTSLDVVVQAGVLDLIRRLREEFGLTIVLITHDLGVVAQVADRVMVMYAGKVVEIAFTEEFFSAPLHPYSKALLFSVPNLDLEDFDLHSLEGSPPDLLNPPKGCRFYPRCFEAMDICSFKEPEVFRISKSRFVRCWKYYG